MRVDVLGIGVARPCLAALRRPATFAAVGLLCFGVQLGVLFLLRALGVPAWLGNGIGFVVSAQLNFLLSALVTWGDRRGRRAVTVGRWASYQGSTLLALAVNVGVFTLTSPLLGDPLGAAVGVVTGTVVTYAVNNWVIFRRNEWREGPVDGRSAPAEVAP